MPAAHDTSTGFDPARFARAIAAGHGGRLGILYHDHAPGWIELALPWRDDLVGEIGGDTEGGAKGGIATGAIAALMDMAAAMSVWAARGRFVAHATLDLRIDRLRASRPGATLIGHGECYRLAGPLAFVRGLAHDGDPDDPVAHVVGSFMTTGAAA